MCVFEKIEVLTAQIDSEIEDDTLKFCLTLPRKNLRPLLYILLSGIFSFLLFLAMTKLQYNPFCMSQPTCVCLIQTSILLPPYQMIMLATKLSGELLGNI